MRGLPLLGWERFGAQPVLGIWIDMIAAEKTGRRCRGVELAPLYVDVIIRRYQKTTGRQALHQDTGEPISALADRWCHEATQLVDSVV